MERLPRPDEEGCPSRTHALNGIAAKTPGMYVLTHFPHSRCPSCSQNSVACEHWLADATHIHAYSTSRTRIAHMRSPHCHTRCVLCWPQLNTERGVRAAVTASALSQNQLNRVLRELDCQFCIEYTVQTSHFTRLVTCDLTVKRVIKWLRLFLHCSRTPVRAMCSTSKLHRSTLRCHLPGAQTRWSFTVQYRIFLNAT